MAKKQKTNTKSKKTDDKIINSILKYQEESSILGNTLFIGFLIFGTLLIIFSIIYYILKVSNPFWMGISAFLISTISAILYYSCQKRRNCKIRMIVD
ncbi:MAG: hypothetical protein V3S79_03480 [Candidatus Thermoplasmatota archaeon]|jgi:hypothetical protein|nr:hypothetical protein [Thermoplasmatales archaeon]